MGRILAIDYGAKRVGLAVTDPLKIIATALVTVDNAKALSFLIEYINKNDVERIIIGYPLNYNDEPTHATALVEKFIIRLNKTFKNLPVDKYDEAFTSKMAVRTLIESGVKKKDRRNRSLIDSVAATIILQQYLQNI